MNTAEISCCRVCKSDKLDLIQEFGRVPLADKLMMDSNDMVPCSDLTLMLCTDCWHLQIKENVDPEILFRRDYPYYSGRIPELVTHFRSYYEAVIERVHMPSDSLVVEIASNDGLLLEHFHRSGFNVLGVEPSLDPAEVAIDKGMKVVKEFFSSAIAEQIVNLEGKGAQLIIANNVLAHVPDPVNLVQGIFDLLDVSGTAIVEVPFSREMIRNGTYDVIFHQHYSYFSIYSLKTLFESRGLFIYYFQLVNTQGGSIRLYLSKTKSENAQLLDLLNEEQGRGLHTLAVYRQFSEKISKHKVQINGLLNELKKAGKSVVAYGAPGKAATYINYNELNKNQINYIADINPAKQSKYFPLPGFPIYSPDRLANDLPDYILILSWNYAPTIINQLSYLKEINTLGFIIPFPEPHVV